MKYYKFYTLGFLLALLNFSNNVFSKSNNKPEIFVLRGEIKDLNIDSVKMDYYPSFSLNMLSPTNTIFSKVNNGMFFLRLPDMKEVGYIFLTFKSPKDEFISLPVGVGFNPLLIEPGDNLVMKINKAGIEFKGVGAAKYNCWIASKKIDEEIVSQGIPALQVLHASTDFFKKLDVLKQQRQSFLKNCIENLMTQRKKLSELSFKLLTLEYQSQAADAVLMEIYMTANLSPNSIEKYLRDNESFFFPKTNIERPDKSTGYIDMLMKKEKILSSLDAEFRKKDKIEQNLKLRDNIIQKYTGCVLDKLLTILVTSFAFGDSTQKFQNHALKTVKTEDNKNYILKHIKTRGIGSDFFNFHLEDSTGKPVSLSDFRNKVIFIDFYFTGCSGCAALAKAMKPVIKEFIDDKNVVFINVCVDQKKEMFIKAVDSEIYSEKTSVNLYTNGEGQSHEMIRYYGFQGYPQFFLIDKAGKILNDNPPRPRSKNGEPDPNNPEVLKLIEIIKKEVAKPSI